MSKVSEVRDKFTEAVARGDVEAIVDLYHDDAVLEAPEGTFRGRDQLREYFQAQLGGFDATLNIVATHDTEDVAVTEWVMEADHTGAAPLPDGGTLPATNRHISQRGADFATIKSGRIVRHRGYYDQLGFLQELGVVDGTGQEAR